MRPSRCFVLGMTVSACLATMSARADGIAVARQVLGLATGAATGQGGVLSGFASDIFGKLLYALTAWLEVALYVTWLAVTWAVMRLYDGLGAYLIPIWDFSNGSGFLQPGGAAETAVGVPAAATQMLQSMVPWLLSLCGVLMFGLSALSLPKAAREGREPFEAAWALAVAAGLLLAFPLLYSAPIHLGNYLGREFYVLSHERYLNASGQGLNGSPPGLFQILVQGSVFPTSTPSIVLPPTSTLVSTLTSAQTPVLSALAHGPSTEEQLSSAFAALTREFAPGGDATVAWESAKQAVMVDLEMQASRFIQILLGLMAIISLLGLLMLKGGQVVALVLNYYLGWIACTLYVHPSTRPVFFAWLKSHFSLCLWGLIWSFLVYIMDIIVVASRGMQGMVQQAGAAAGVGMSVGMFLMPFMLFAAIHKFRHVSDFADALSATGRVATRVGASVQAAFAEGKEMIPVGLQEFASMGSAHAFASEAVDNAGKAFCVGMERVAAAASKALNLSPGPASVAGAIVGKGIVQAGTLGEWTAHSAARLLRNTNRFHGVSWEEKEFIERTRAM